MMYGYPYMWGMPPQPSTSPVEEAERWIKFLKEQEEKKKKEEKPGDKKARTFSTLETFVLVTFCSIVIGPVAGLIYLTLLMNLMKNYATVIQPLLK